MADPVTWITIGSTAISAMGAMAQGNAQAASYKAQAQAANYNATMNRMNADQTSAEYGQKEIALRQQQEQFLGRQRAAIAETGTGPGGSGADVMAEDTQHARLDDLTLRYEGQTRRTAYLNQSNLDKYQGQVAYMNAGEASKAGKIGALGAVLSGVGRYYDYSNSTKAFS